MGRDWVLREQKGATAPVSPGQVGARRGARGAEGRRRPTHQEGDFRSMLKSSTGLLILKNKKHY